MSSCFAVFFHYHPFVWNDVKVSDLTRANKNHSPMHRPVSPSQFDLYLLCGIYLKTAPSWGPWADFSFFLFPNWQPTQLAATFAEPGR